MDGCDTDDKNRGFFPLYEKVGELEKDTAYIKSILFSNSFKGDFVPGTLYNTGDIVLYEDVLKESLVDGNDSAPSDVTKWKDSLVFEYFAKKNGDRTIEFYAKNGNDKDSVITQERLLEKNSVDFNKKDLILLKKFMREKNIRLVSLGDSIPTGIGAGGDTYSEVDRYGIYYPDNFFAHLMSGLGIKLKEDDTYPLKNVWLTVSSGRSFTTYVDEGDSVSLLIQERTSDKAPDFRVTIYGDDDSVVYNETSYVEEHEISSTLSKEVNKRLVVKQFDTSTLSGDMKVVMDNLTVTDRGLGDYDGDGSIRVFGVLPDADINFSKFSVSSSTLKNISDANIDRKITTDEQFSKAIATNPNIAMICYGTNDSKDGDTVDDKDDNNNVMSASEFKEEYIMRINQLRNANPEMVVIIATTPVGAEKYNENYEYNTAIREIADEMNVSILDLRKMTEDTNIQADDVHINETGHKLIVDNMSYFLPQSIERTEVFFERFDENANFIINNETGDTREDTLIYDFAFFDIDNRNIEIEVLISANNITDDDKLVSVWMSIEDDIGTISKMLDAALVTIPGKSVNPQGAVKIPLRGVHFNAKKTNYRLRIESENLRIQHSLTSLILIREVK